MRSEKEIRDMIHEISIKGYVNRTIDETIGSLLALKYVLEGPPRYSLAELHLIADYVVKEINLSVEWMEWCDLWEFIQENPEKVKKILEEK